MNTAEGRKRLERIEKRLARPRQKLAECPATLAAHRPASARRANCLRPWAPGWASGVDSGVQCWIVISLHDKFVLDRHGLVANNVCCGFGSVTRRALSLSHLSS